MIHTARQTGKFIKLVRRIRMIFPDSPVDPETIAVGILERLWHLTMASTPRGDIGQLDDEIIAEGIGWLGDSEQIIGLLVDAKWLDRCPSNRLVVHGWEDHAPAYVKRNIKRQGGFLSSQEHPKRTPERLSTDLTAHASGQVATPNLTQPNLTQPNPTKPKKGRARFAKPTVEEIQKYIEEKNYTVDAQAFHDYYESNGWRVGRSAMKSWQAAIGGWQRREKEFATNGKSKDDPRGNLALRDRLIQQGVFE